LNAQNPMPLARSPFENGPEFRSLPAKLIFPMTWYLPASMKVMKLSTVLSFATSTTLEFGL